MGNPEQEAFRNLERRSRTDEIKEVADKLLRSAEKVRATLAEIAFDPKKFEALYSVENVANDLRYVEGRKRDFEAFAHMEAYRGLTEGDIKSLSERVEYEVIRGINVGQWFEGVSAYKTSEYDDIAGGVDAILEITDGSSYGHLGMGIDITFSQDVEKKFRRIKDEIDNYDGEENRLAHVKYFKSENTGFTGMLSDLARVVIAVDVPMLEDMARVKDAQSLHGHVSKHVTLLEMQHQLQVFLSYAERKNQKAVKAMERAANFIDTLVETLRSEDKLTQSEYTRNRRADDALARGLELFT
jgi:hypothetical protein